MNLEVNTFHCRLNKYMPIFGLLIATSVFWGRYLFERGIHAETYFTILSQNRPLLEGFLYPEKNRPFMSLLFHMAYIFSDGSYLSLHILYGVTIFLTGLVTYLLFLELFGRRYIIFCFLAGVITIINGSEESANLFSMIIVRQALVAILIAAYIVCIYYKNKKLKYLCILIPACNYLSLWTYEAGFPLIVILGISILFFKRERLYLLALWYSVPIYFIFDKIHFYLIKGNDSYQSKKIVFQSFYTIVEKFYYYIKYGLDFLLWPKIWIGRFNNCELEALSLLAPSIILGVISIIFIFILQLRRSNFYLATPSNKNIIYAFTLLIASYVPFAFVSDGSPTWRTQFYAAPFSAFLLTYLCCFLYQIRYLRILSLVLLVSILGCGFYSGLAGQLEASKRWLVYRNAVEGITIAAPQIRDGTTVVLLGIPTGDPMQICKDSDPPDPFSDQLWFDYGVNVLYPKTRLRGFYVRSDGSYPPSSNQKVLLSEGGLNVINKNNDEILSIPYNEVLIFQYDDRAKSTKLLTQDSIKKIGYDPSALILSGPRPDRTINKFKAHVKNLP